MHVKKISQVNPKRIVNWLWKVAYNEFNDEQILDKQGIKSL